jgi:hypothetical protein
MPSFDPNKDYYHALGISKGASRRDIDQAYRNYAKKYHPDVGGSESEMKLLNEAYEVLKSPATRRAYDAARGNYLIDNESLSPFASQEAYRVNRSERPTFNNRVLSLPISAVTCFGFGFFLLDFIGHRRLWPLRLLSVSLFMLGVFLAHCAIKLKRRELIDINASSRQSLFQKYEGILLALGFGVFVAVIMLIYVK